MFDERVILERMRGGDESALGLFMQEYTGLLYYRALAIVHDKMAAEDIVQEVFIRFWDQRKELQESSVVPAYLTRLARNACVNYLEYQEVRRRHAKSYHEHLAREEEPGEWDEERLEECRRRLQEFIASLPERCREVFVLACVEGLKYHEVAGRLHVSVNTVKSQVKHAYAKLKRVFNLTDQELLLILILARHFS
jgi:RNA polymerase sigma-70 factor (ECF subfamily)